MDTPDSLLQKWESVEVPSTYVSDWELDADKNLLAMEEKFFGDVRRVIALGERALSSGIVKIEYRNVLSANDHITDDKMQIWSLDGIQPLASMLKTRNDPNYVVAQFSKYSLTERAVDRILKFQELKDEIEHKQES